MHDRLLSAVLAAPGDDAPRLVYADALLERGDPRGEFIRLQCELESLDPRSGLHAMHTKRAATLLEQHCVGWTGFPPQGLQFRRGFVEALTVFDPRMDALLEREPITSLILTGFKVAALAQLALWPGLAKMNTIVLATDDGGRLFQKYNLNQRFKHEFPLGPASSLVPLLERLTPATRALRLMGFDFANDLDPLTRLDATLDRLVLECCQLGPTAMAKLVALPVMKNLVGLGLTANPLGDDGAKLLAAQAPPLHELSLGSTNLGREGFLAIVESPLGSRLKHLELGGGEPPGMPPAKWGWSYDDFRGDESNPLPLETLFAAELPALESLGLAKVLIGDRVRLLAAAPFVRQLKALDLTSTGTWSDATRGLEDSGALTGLERFEVPEAPFHGFMLQAASPAIAAKLTRCESGYTQKIDLATAERLAIAIKRAPNLAEVSWNVRDVAEGVAPILAGALATRPLLRELSFRGFGASETSLLLRSGLNLRSLGVSTRRERESVGSIVSGWPGCDDLESLSLFGCDDIDAVELVRGRWTALRELRLIDGPLTNQGLRALLNGAFPSLMLLDLTGTAIDGEALGLLAAAELPKIEEVCVLENEKLLGPAVEKWDRTHVEIERSPRSDLEAAIAALSRRMRVTR